MSSKNTSTRLFAGITVPDTPLITKAIDLARKHLDDIGYGHVMRSWLFGCLIILRLPAAQREVLDVEAFSIAVILHDLGWSQSPEFRSNDKIFEVDGANGAREFLKREGNPSEWDKHRIQLVWDSIALHTGLVAPFKESEVAITNAGIFAELFGPSAGSNPYLGEAISRITGEEIDTISKEFPRTGLKEYMKEVMCGFCREKPEVTYLTFVSGFGDRYVEGYSSKGKQLVDMVMDTLVE